MVEFAPDRIVGRRLILRLPVADDDKALFARVAGDPEVTRYLLWAPHHDVAATRRVLTEVTNVNPNAKTWAITLRHNNEIIGLISCRREARHAVEVGYCMGQQWWGRGYMSETLSMLVGSLAADSGLYRVWATCSVDNARSARLLERAGFGQEGRLARHAVYPGLGSEPRDSLLYAKILR
jgi:[ribosomal protein S5]-alanine N-acetyltransferase